MVAKQRLTAARTQARRTVNDDRRCGPPVTVAGACVNLVAYRTKRYEMAIFYSCANQYISLLEIAGRRHAFSPTHVVPMSGLYFQLGMRC